MNDCPNSLQQDHISDIAELKTIVKEHGNKIERLDEIRDAVVSIKTYLGFQKEESEKMNVILTQLSCNVNDLSGQVKEVKTNVGDLKNQVNDLQCKFKDSEDKNIVKIDVREEAKKSWIKRHSLPIGIGGSIIGVLALVYGFLQLIGVF